MNNFKILCIDDEPDILKVYDIYLGKQYEVLTAKNANEAIEILKAHHSEIVYVFSDYLMPEKTGIDFRAEMLNLGFEIPFALITGHYTIEMAKQGMELRISSFIEKPFNEKTLEDLIADLGEKRKIALNEEKEMVCSFISESTPMIDEIEGLILVLENDPHDINALNTYFRLLHTIKGTASCVGLKSLPKFAHAYEDIVSLAKEHKVSITKKYVDSLLFGLDRLKYMYQEITNGSKFEFDVEEWILKIKSFEDNSHDNIIDIKANDETAKDQQDHSHDPKKAASEKLAIPIETLDSFMELSGNLTILRNTIYKAISRVELKYTNDKDIEVLSSTIDDLQKTTGSIQKQISEMRKIGTESITRPLRRVVRDTSKELNKEVELKIFNENIKIDNTIAKIVSNSLVHLIRNSIDHGIEKPEQRKNTNKNPMGTIELTFIEDGDNNIVILKDDGAGINKKRVLKTAIEKHIVSEKDAALMSSSEINSLIFASGFSTSEQVSNISGRGVGMDMVKSSVESIGGKIIIESNEGTGSIFTLVLPLPKNVLINKTLMIEEENECFSIPIDSVVEVVKVTSENHAQSVMSVGGYPVLKRHEELIPIFKLKNCLELNSHKKLELNHEIDFTAIIIKHEESKIGLIVDRVHDIEESVIRKIKSVIHTSPIYSGVTYYGDEGLALVLNIENLTKENINSIKIIKEVNSKINDTSLKVDAMKEIDYFTFSFNKNQYGMLKQNVNRIELLQSKNIESFQGNYFIKHKENIIKLIALDESKFKNIYDDEYLKIILMKSKNHYFGLYVDEFHEFITSHYSIEHHFSKSTLIEGSIIHEDQIIYIIDEAKLNELVESQSIYKKEEHESLPQEVIKLAA